MVVSQVLGLVLLDVFKSKLSFIQYVPLVPTTFMTPLCVCKLGTVGLNLFYNT